MRVIANNIPYSLYSEQSNYYDYLKANYWINNVIDSGGSVSQSNKDIMVNRYNTATATKNFWTIPLTLWDFLQIWFTNDGWTPSCWPFTISYEVDLKKKWEYDSIPNEIIPLWQQLTISLFWLINNEFYVWEETNSVTTWNITPWNFVWYVQIGKYKFPYYL